MMSVGELFKGRCFDREIVILCMRWWLRSKLSFRDLVETGVPAAGARLQEDRPSRKWGGRRRRERLSGASTCPRRRPATTRLGHAVAISAPTHRLAGK